MARCFIWATIAAALTACSHDSTTNNSTNGTSVTTAACAAYPAPTVSADPVVAGPATEPTTCQTPVVTSALAASQVQHLGTHTVGDVVPFTIPAKTAGFSIVLQAMQSSVNEVELVYLGQDYWFPNYVIPLYVQDPSFSYFFNDFAGTSDPAGASAYVVSWAQVAGTFSAPNTAATVNAWKTNGASTGTWRLTVSDWAYECALLEASGECISGADTTGTYDVTVLTQPGGPTSASGTLDVRLYLVTNSFTAAQAVGDPGMQRVVSTLTSIYAEAGLCVGTVTFVDVPAWAKSKYATGIDDTATNPCDNLGQMFALSKAGNALNFFLVDDIHQGSSTGPQTVGLDGSIPGPSTMGGTVNSGAVVNASDVGTGTCNTSIDFANCGSDLTAYIIGHEGGHWLGLYHTTEATGDTFDPLSDTGQCTCSSCAPAAQKANCSTNAAVPYNVIDTDCNKGGQCQGTENLMFWLVSKLSSGQLTAQQGLVMRSNPAVH